MGKLYIAAFWEASGYTYGCVCACILFRNSIMHVASSVVSMYFLITTVHSLNFQGIFFFCCFFLLFFFKAASLLYKVPKFVVIALAIGVQLS